MAYELQIWRIKQNLVGKAIWKIDATSYKRHMSHLSTQNKFWSSSQKKYDILVSIVLFLLKVYLPLYNILPSPESVFSKLMNDPFLHWLLQPETGVALNFVSFSLYHINHHILLTLSPWLNLSLLPLQHYYFYISYHYPLCNFKKITLFKEIVLALIITYLSCHSNYT